MSGTRPWLEFVQVSHTDSSVTLARLGDGEGEGSGGIGAKRGRDGSSVKGGAGNGCRGAVGLTVRIDARTGDYLLVTFGLPAPPAAAAVGEGEGEMASAPEPAAKAQRGEWNDSNPAPHTSSNPYSHPNPVPTKVSAKTAPRAPSAPLTLTRLQKAEQLLTGECNSIEAHLSLTRMLCSSEGMEGVGGGGGGGGGEGGGMQIFSDPNPLPSHPQVRPLATLETYLEVLYGQG